MSEEIEFLPGGRRPLSPILMTLAMLLITIVLAAILYLLVIVWS